MWQVEGAGKYNCMRLTMSVAESRVKSFGATVIVRYIGKKPPWPNNNLERLDFALWTNGHRDYSIDPTWYGHIGGPPS